MNETQEKAIQHRRIGLKRAIWVSRLFFGYVFDSLVDGLVENVRIVEREFQIFMGAALFLLGMLGFESDKYCDGNTADYLSCTRPSTYYFYDYADIALIVIGAMLVLAWYLKRNSRIIKDRP